MIIKEVMKKNNKRSNEEESTKKKQKNLLKAPMIAPYYLFPLRELRNVLFISFDCYFTGFKVCEFKFLFLK